MWMGTGLIRALAVAADNYQHEAQLFRAIDM